MIQVKLIPMLQGHKFVIASIVVAFAINSMSASAKPSYARQFKQQFGYSPSCHACHKEGGGTPVNSYGQAFKDKGKSIAAFNLIATLDSDNDGFNNALEASKKSNPGDAASTPSAPGNWLDLSSLIPKEVQALFPDATAWKPLDAILTEKDIARAKTMGVTLNAEDENTIYIPVADRRPIGTALIFPVNVQNKSFFLITATDRDLNISQVVALKTGHVPASLSPELLEKFVGMPLQSITQTGDNTLDEHISQAVKKAGVLVYIRLKGA